METTTTGGGEAEAATAVAVEQVQIVAERTIPKVLVAIDDSEESFYALNWTLENILMNNKSHHPGGGEGGGDGLRGGIVTVVHAQQPFQPFGYPAAGPGVVYASPALMKSMRIAQEQNAASIFSHALQLCKEKKVKAETLILKGDPKEMICQAVEEMRVDLLVVGSRGFGHIKRAILGSVSDYCAHHAKCPILIVKLPKESQ